jgi:hypothetical protein
MRIRLFLSLLEENIENNDRDIFADIVQAHSINTIEKAEIKVDKESRQDK